MLWVRKLHCRGCGTKFHQSEPTKFGFQQTPRIKAKQSFRGINQEHIASIYERLTPEQQQALNFLPPGLQMTSKSSAQILEKAKEERKMHKFVSFCRPCIDSQDGRTLPLETPKPYMVPGGNHHFVETIDAFDFPASLGPIAADTDYVLTRADLVLSHPNQVSRLREYAQTVLAPLGVPASRVHVVSTAKNWGLGELAKRLTRKTFFQGQTCTGKTALVNALVGHKEKTWPVPFKTKQATLHAERMVDTPSRTETEVETGIYGVLKSSLVRSVVAAKMMLKKDNKYNAEPTVAKPGQVVSIGGLVAIEIPHGVGNAVHVWSVHGGQGATMALSSLEKVHEINTSTLPAHAGWAMTESTDKMKLRFEADDRNLELAIRGLGPVFIKSFGRHEGGSYKVWSLPGVHVVKRPAILPVLLHRKAARERAEGKKLE